MINQEISFSKKFDQRKDLLMSESQDPAKVEPVRLGPESRFKFKCVITSYSIHYTKLYDIYLVEGKTFFIELYKISKQLKKKGKEE